MVKKYIEIAFPIPFIVGDGQVAAIVGEPGVGKSRLVFELIHSHRIADWLILEAGSVSYGKATSYLPVITLLKGYFRIGDRDTYRDIREKMTGKLLTLDRALEPTLPALLALLDVPVDDPQWEALDPPRRRQRTLEAVKRLLLRETQLQPLLVVFEDLHWIDSETQALLERLVESLPTARALLLVNYRPEYSHGWGTDEAMANIETLLNLPLVRFLSEEEGFWDVYRATTAEVPTRGNLVPDAWFAALAIEAGCEWITLDRDYARFPALRWGLPV